MRLPCFTVNLIFTSIRFRLQKPLICIPHNAWNLQFTQAPDHLMWLRSRSGDISQADHLINGLAPDIRQGRFQSDQVGMHIGEDSDPHLSDPAKQTSHAGSKEGDQKSQA